MRCLAHLFLILFVVTLASAKTSAESTGNLLSNDFTDGTWTTNIQSYHGSNTIAGVDGQYVESKITLSDHMNSIDIENVYQSDLTADVWFWNNESQSVTISQTISDTNGKEYSNNTVVSGTCATWNGCDFGTAPTNSILITDVASDYDIVSRFSFSVPSQPDYHYGADLRDPSLILYFEPFKMDVETVDDVDIWLDDFDKKYEAEFKDETFTFTDVFKEEEIKMNEYYLFEEDMYMFMEEPKDDKTEEEFIEEFKEEPTTDKVDEFIEEFVEEELTEEKMPEELLEEPDQDIETSEPQTFTIGKTMFAEAIDIDQTKITVMIQSQPIMVDPEFYAPINIYVEQISLFDDRQIYGNIIYNVANDPVNAYNNLIEGNKEQQYKLKEKLESMTWRN
jgi:hypothetical protein